jgi:hypothetical protein
MLLVVGCKLCKYGLQQISSEEKVTVCSTLQLYQLFSACCILLRLEHTRTSQRLFHIGRSVKIIVNQF